MAGARRDLIVVTTTYGRTIAIDANSGALLWTFTPPGYAGWAGSAQITNASPIADPDRRFVYATSPNGLVHKLSLSSGREDSAGAWPVSITRDATHEKLGSALNIDGPDVIATTSGYIGDIPTYQGHVVLITRASGRLLTGLQHALRKSPHDHRPDQLPTERLGDPLTRRGCRGAGRRAAADRHRQWQLERQDGLR